METTQSAELREFLAAYRAALAWSTSDWSDDPGGLQLESLEGYEFSPEALATTAADCASFIAANRSALNEATSRAGYGWACAGHDFWLTRAGHGVGYWDRAELDAGRLGDRLTEASRQAGEQWPYIGDDGRVHLS